MAKKIPEPKFLSGFMHLLEEPQDSLDTFPYEFFFSETDEKPYILSRGNIFNNEKALKNRPNEIIIFDFELEDFWGGSFRGFLYPDGTVNGKIKYVEKSKLQDCRLEGEYKWLNKKKLNIVGSWINADGTEDGFFISLIK